MRACHREVATDGVRKASRARAPDSPGECRTHERPGQTEKMEVDSNTAAVCREDQCGEIWNGKGSGEDWEGFEFFILGKSEGVYFPNVEVILNHGAGELNPAPARGSRERWRPAAHPA